MEGLVLVGLITVCLRYMSFVWAPARSTQGRRIFLLFQNRVTPACFWQESIDSNLARLTLYVGRNNSVYIKGALRRSYR
jgi:hypothetical protein